ncbi:MAG: VWA domain-containing protein [Acidobacteriota bacterium]
MNLRGIGQRAFCALAWIALAAVLPAHAAEISFASPPEDQAAFGPVEVRVATAPGSAISRVEFFLDGKLAGTAEKAPFRVVIDVGQDNVGHRFEAVAYGPGGSAIASTAIRTPSIATDLTIDVLLRQLYVTVYGGKEHLKSEDFTLRERGGARPKVVTFERGDIPFTAALLIDSSVSMSGERLKSALDGARTFFRSMRPLDEAKLLLFADQLQLETPFTSVPGVLDLALSGAHAGGGTAINDVLYLAVDRLAPRAGRRVIILLSDGGEIESVLSMSWIRKRLEAEPMALYWVRLRREEEQRGPTQRWSIWRDARGHAWELQGLERAVADSGGRIEVIDSIDQVAGALGHILDELRNQYVLGYYSESPGEDPWRGISVDVKGGGRVRVQKGTARR